MINISEIKELLPIKIRNYKLKMLAMNKADEYCNELMSDYYNEYVDNKFQQPYASRKDVILHIKNLITSYEENGEINRECRLILVNEKNEIIGGSVIFQPIDGIELGLAYFIKPIYQNKGIAYEMMQAIIERVRKTSIEFNYFKLVIQNTNLASIALSKKLGFYKAREEKGRFTTNYIMLKHRLGEIKQ